MLRGWQGLPRAGWDSQDSQFWGPGLWPLMNERDPKRPPFQRAVPSCLGFAAHPLCTHGWQPARGHGFLSLTSFGN